MKLIAYGTTFMLAYSFLGIPPGRAQAQSTSTMTTQQRRDDLANVLSLVADPDPLKRIANMESIVRSHDAEKIQIAIKSAFASDDPQIRGLAMSAYMASVKQLVFELHLPPRLQQDYDAVSDDEQQRQQFESVHHGINNLRDIDFQLKVAILEFSTSSNHGRDSVNGQDGTFVVSGDRFQDVTYRLSGYPCAIEFRPTRSLTLEGTLRCQATPHMTITATLF